jgi:hypothetical protein
MGLMGVVGSKGEEVVGRRAGVFFTDFLGRVVTALATYYISESSSGTLVLES